VWQILRFCHGEARPEVSENQQSFQAVPFGSCDYGMMQLEEFRVLLQEAYSALIAQDRHVMRMVHLKPLFQEMKLHKPKLSLPEFKSHLATLHAENCLVYEMDRGSTARKVNDVYGIEGQRGNYVYLRIRLDRNKA